MITWPVQNYNYKYPSVLSEARNFSSFFFFNFFLMFIFGTERDRAWAGEGQREREIQNLKQAPGSELSAQSPTRGSNSQTARSRPEPKSDAQLPEPPRHPNVFLFCWKFPSLPVLVVTFMLPRRADWCLVIGSHNWDFWIKRAWLFHVYWLTLAIAFKKGCT